MRGLPFGSDSARSIHLAFNAFRACSSSSAVRVRAARSSSAARVRVAHSSSAARVRVALSSSAARACCALVFYIGGQMDVNFLKSLHRFTVVYT